eukprot:TRINITY_DN1046_c0_g1_i1.p1 TRINITY_DN1046_c0_g1~~TRINITY_DN1046_c0_g1_i1.p1  ORF type:complete len:232 (-),score=57.17 TRINITY_DN1046_c0_g1_i1:407-1102(-)
MVLVSGVDCETESSMALLLIDQAAMAAGVFSSEYGSVSAEGVLNAVPNLQLGSSVSNSSASSIHTTAGMKSAADAAAVEELRKYSTSSCYGESDAASLTSSKGSSDLPEISDTFSMGAVPLKIDEDDDDLCSETTSTQSRPVPLNSKFVESLHGFELPPSSLFGGKRGGQFSLGSHVVGLSPSPYANFYQKHSMARVRGKNYSRSLLTNSALTNENPSGVTCESLLSEIHS